MMNLSVIKKNAPTAVLSRRSGRLLQVFNVASLPPSLLTTQHHFRRSSYSMGRKSLFVGEKLSESAHLREVSCVIDGRFRNPRFHSISLDRRLSYFKIIPNTVVSAMRGESSDVFVYY
jgi:hypothetical protein